MRKIVALLLTQLAMGIPLAGCASVLGSGPPPSGGLQPDGTNVLSERERQMDCRSLTSTALGHVDEMKRRVAMERAARETPPRTIIQTVARAVGAENTVSTNVTVFKHEKATVLAMNAALAEKSCPPVDIDSLAGDDIRWIEAPAGR